MNKKIYIIFAVILLLITIIYNKYIESFDNENNIVIVISRYNENLEWLKEEPFNKYPVIIYNKGPNDEYYKPDKLIKTENIKNVGREGHTYLYYIIQNYNNLYNINIFLPGSANMEKKMPHCKKLIEHIEKNNKSIFLSNKISLNDLYNFQLDNYSSTSQENNSINPENNLELSEIRPFGKWYEDKFKNIELNYVTYGGMFSISKEDIIHHPIQYYKNLIKYLENSSNPEVGHYFERAWEAVFYPMNNTLKIKEL
jgi:hypothetical protein